MSQANDLLQTLAASQTQTQEPEDTTTLVIDHYLRTIIIPKGITTLGVEYDDDVMYLNFKMPRYLDKTDLSAFTIRINYINANGESDAYTVKSPTVTSTYIAFSWLVGPTATAYKGKTRFNVCLKLTDSEGVVQKEYNTAIASLPVLEGLETDPAIISEYTDILEQWRRELFGIGDTEEANIKAASQTEQEAISQKGVEVLATIPEDYTTTYNLANEAVRTKADAIICSAEGEIIKVSDSSDDHLRGLRVFGKTTQVSTTGKNLAYVNINVADYSYLGVVCSETEDGNISLNGIATSNMWNRLASAELVAGETYTLSGNKTVALSVWDVTADGSFTVKSANSTSITFVAPNTGSYSIVLENPTGAVFADVRADIMLTAGSSALSWEPYSGGLISPSPEWPQALRSVEDISINIDGKNLVNSILVGATSTQYGNCLLVGMNEFKPNTTYTLSFIAAPGHKMYLNENLFSYQYIIGDGTRQHITMTTKPIVDSSKESQYTSNHWIILKNSEGNSVQPAFKDVQIELGSAPTDYVENAPRQTVTLDRTLPGIPVTSGGNYTDSNGQQWICDEIDFERGVYVQHFKSLAFTGQENWVQDTNYTCTYRVGAGYIAIGGLCTHYPTYFITEDIGSVSGVYLAYTVNHIITDTRFVNDLAGFTEFLAEEYASGNPVTVLRRLNEPIETPLSADEIAAFQALKSNYPSTTVLNDAGTGMVLCYNADTETWITNLIDEKIAAAVAKL